MKTIYNHKPHKEASFYTRNNNNVICNLCPHKCNLTEGQTGICRTRKNIGGTLLNTAFGKVCAIHTDPIEKKPLYHFYPSKEVLSLSTAGCNLRCLNCQNWQLSQKKPNELEYQFKTPEEIVDYTIKNQCSSIAYTYGEPIVYYEYAYETAKLAHQNNIDNILISAGYICETPLRNICKYLSAANIDFKVFNEKKYRTLNGINMDHVLRTLKILKEENIWLEITNLIIPGWTDNEKEIDKMCAWLTSNGFEDTPLHFSRFFPTYRLAEMPSTPEKALEKAYKIAKSNGIKYVYLGNINSDKNHTYCPNCNQILIERNGYSTQKKNLTGNTCNNCNSVISGVF